MSVAIELAELLAWSDGERAKWRAWFGADPSRAALPFQRGGSFPTLGHLLDHVFLVERRHLARLVGGTPPASTGIEPTDVHGLFEYAALVRADFREYVGGLDEREARVPLTVPVQGGMLLLTRRKLALHIVMHEVRHFAQLAFAARAAGHDPPGRHDLAYCPELA